MKFITAIAALFVATVANAQVPFTDCANGPTDLVIESFKIEPYPLCVGKNVTATGTGVLSTPVIAGAKLSIIGKYLGRIVYNDNHDLCTLMAGEGHPCPIPTTLTSISAKVPVKSTAPANIPVQLTVQATNGNNHLLFCQSATVTATKNC
ncbi:hypothetical protein BGZ67_010036 [Mortierella alpina]|nr:hypothetical protein BGZ67_010036 [Mortierella alpina]